MLPSFISNGEKNNAYRLLHEPPTPSTKIIQNPKSKNKKLDSGLKLYSCVPLQRPEGSINHTNIVQVLQSPTYSDEGACPFAQTVTNKIQTNNYLVHN